MAVTVLPSGSNDTAALNSAISQMGGQADLLQLEEGLYKISSSILAAPNLTMSGRGDATIIKLLDGANTTMITNLGGYSIWRENVTLQHFKLDGNKANQTAGHGILRTGTGAVYEGISLVNIWGRGISHNGGDGARLLGCYAAGCSRHGFHMEGSANAEISDCEAHECGTIVGVNENRAIHGYNAANLKILRTRVYGGGGVEQIGAWACPDVVISDCELYDGINMGIAPFSVRAQVLRNRIYNAGNNAIDTRGEGYNLVEENFIDHVMRNPLGGGTNSDVENSGICCNGSFNRLIRNTIAFCGRAGIHVANDEGNEFLENAIRNCGQQGAGPAGIWIQLWAADAINKGTVIRRNRCYDDQPVKTQLYGVWLNPDVGYIDDVVIMENDLRNNKTAGVSQYASSTRVRNATIQQSDYVAPPTGTLIISTTPVSGPIYVDGVLRGAGEVQLVLDIGTYAVSFGDAPGYIAPLSQAASVTAGGTTEITGTYVATAPPPLRQMAVTINVTRV